MIGSAPRRPGSVARADLARLRRVVELVADPERAEVTLGDRGAVRAVGRTGFGVKVVLDAGSTPESARRAVVEAIRAATGRAGLGPTVVEFSSDAGG